MVLWSLLAARDRHVRVVQMDRWCSSAHGAARRSACHEWTWDSVWCRAAVLSACERRICIACGPWMDRSGVRVVFGDNWVTLLKTQPCTPGGSPAQRSRPLAAHLDTRQYRLYVIYGR